MKSFYLQQQCSSIYTIVVASLFIGFLSGCNKDPYSEQKRLEDYDINKQNSLRLFLPVMYNDSDDVREELFKIVHISDAHVSPWSCSNHTNNPNNIKEAVRFANDAFTRINALVATGDHISNRHDDRNTTTRGEAINYMNIAMQALYDNNRIPTFATTGNHDANMLNPNFIPYALSKTDLYNHLTSKINHRIYSEGTENYYYADLENPMGGVIRIIALDVTDQDDDMLYNAQHIAILSQKQIDWLCHTALKTDMTALHSVIILIHHPLPPDEEELKRLINAHTAYLYNWNMLPEIIEAFRTKQALTKKYRNNQLLSDSIAVDVSFCNSPGEFICYMGGHLHTYLNYEVKVTSESMLPKQIMILANNMSPSEKSSTTPIERTETGLHNNTFNLYAIDTKNKIIYVTFFGATGFYYQEVLRLPYL
jgi:predicted MPP superfamily phosphohydrolase